MAKWKSASVNTSTKSIAPDTTNNAPFIDLTLFCPPLYATMQAKKD